MSLILKYRTVGYHTHLRKYAPEGICTGLSCEWIMSILRAGKIADLKPPVDYFPATYYQEEYVRLFPYYKNYLQFQFESFAKDAATFAEITWTHKGDYAPVHHQVVRRSITMSHFMAQFKLAKKKTILCLLGWQFHDDTGHLVAFMKTSKEEVYFFDPEIGVFQWIDTGKDFLIDVQQHLEKTLGVSYAWYNEVLYIDVKKNIKVVIS